MSKSVLLFTFYLFQSTHKRLTTIFVDAGAKRNAGPGGAGRQTAGRQSKSSKKAVILEARLDGGKTLVHDNSSTANIVAM